MFRHLSRVIKSYKGLVMISALWSLYLVANFANPKNNAYFTWFLSIVFIVSLLFTIALVLRHFLEEAEETRLKARNYFQFSPSLLGEDGHDDATFCTLGLRLSMLLSFMMLTEVSCSRT
jgi:hypothetical protein